MFASHSCLFSHIPTSSNPFIAVAHHMPSDFSLQSQSPDLPCSPVPTFSHQPCTYITSPLQLLYFLPLLPSLCILISETWNLNLLLACFEPLPISFGVCTSCVPLWICLHVWAASWSHKLLYLHLVNKSLNCISLPSCLHLGPIPVFALVFQATNESSNMACQLLLCTEYLVFE